MENKIINKSPQTAWFALKSKRSHEESLLNYLQTNSKVLDVFVFRNKNDNSLKLPKPLWPGIVFVKTHLVDKNINKDLQQFIVDSSYFSSFYSYGRSYWGSSPVLMSEKLIDKMIQKIQSVSEPTTGKFSSDQIDFKVNDLVTVLSGIFRGYEGEVTEINFTTGIITLNTEFFGRITPIQVGFLECKKVTN